MSEREDAFTPAWRWREMIAAKEVSPVEVAEFYLRRIEALNPQLNAYLTVAADRALADAKSAENAVAQGAGLGPLHGVPMGVKDLTETGDIRTTNGSRFYKDYVPEKDELTAARLRNAGAVILGKTNTPEFGHSATTENMLGEPCRNPWDTERSPGGSSGGTAAGLAAGMHPLATGSDGGGSIRIPASMSGVYGIKPTQGRVARPYYPPGGWRPFSCNGPMSNTVRDSAILLSVMAGYDASDPPSIPGPSPDFTAGLDDGVAGLRIGWSADMGSVPVDPEVRRIAESAALAFGDLGAHVEQAALTIDHERVFTTWETIWLSDMAANYARYYHQRPYDLTPTLREQIARGLAFRGTDISLALRELEWLRAEIKEAVGCYDLLLTPTMATAAFPIGQRPAVIDGQAVEPWWGFTPFSYPINLSGHPAASVPCGFTSEGLPVGLHIIGQHADEAAVLRASAAFEQARPWSGRRPPVS